MAVEKEEQPRIEPDRGRPDGPIVTKISGDDLDRTIERLSEATAPYFRPGGPLMPDRP